VDEVLRATLLELRDRDRRKRQELIGRDELWTGYHAEMEAVHRENARVLERVLDERGWPAVADVGEDGSEAAWVVAIHAIGEPAFQRRCLRLLERAVRKGGARAARWASLLDRIRFNERRPQVYGTLFDWDESGRMSPWPIEAAQEVEARRREVGLPPLRESVREVRERSAREGGRAPKPFDERQAEIRAWSRRVGWLDDRSPPESPLSEGLRGRAGEG
jgi:hypothetical protein